MAYIARKRLVVGHTPVVNDDGEAVIGPDGWQMMEPIVRMPGDLVPEAETWPQHIIDAHIRNEQLQPDEISLNGPALLLVRSLMKRVEALEALAGITAEETPEETSHDETDESVAEHVPGTTPRRKKVA